MPTPTIQELLARQFFDWEERGRGWLSAELPVELEPPFGPFPGHSVPYVPTRDDGRRSTALSQLAETFFGQSAPQQRPASGSETKDEPTPRLLEHDGDLRLFSVSIPREQKMSDEAADAFL